MARETVLTPKGSRSSRRRSSTCPAATAPRGRRAHQGGARVRRHLRELGVRRRQERAGDAREADRRPRGEAPQRPVIDEKSVDTDVVSVGVDRPRQGPEDRQVGEVQDRRLGRGQPGREEALERVARRQGPARPQARRDRHRAGAARPRAQAQDHQDRAPEPQRVSAGGRPPRQARAPARAGHRPVPAPVRGRRPHRRDARRHDASSQGEETDRRLPRRRPDGRPPRPGRRRLPRPGRPLGQAPAARQARRARRGVVRPARLARPRRPDRRRRHRLQDPPRRADPARRRTGSCSPSRCARRPRSSTASRTSRRATATASST